MVAVQVDLAYTHKHSKPSKPTLLSGARPYRLYHTCTSQAIAVAQLYQLANHGGRRFQRRGSCPGSGLLVQGSKCFPRSALQNHCASTTSSNTKFSPFLAFRSLSPSMRAAWKHGIWMIPQKTSACLTSERVCMGHSAQGALLSCAILDLYMHCCFLYGVNVKKLQSARDIPRVMSGGAAQPLSSSNCQRLAWPCLMKLQENPKSAPNALKSRTADAASCFSILALCYSILPLLCSAFT